MEFSKELIKKTKACRTAEELMALAKKNEIELTKEDAEALLGEFREGEVSDEELDNVAGGQEGCAKPANPYEDVYWKKEEDVQFLFKEGDLVQAFALGSKHHTATCKVVSKKADAFYREPIGYSPRTLIGWADAYWLEKVPGCKTPFIKGWNQRHDIEK